MNLFGLIGYPLTHSFSAQYFTEKFDRENLKDYVFKAFPIANIHELPDLLTNNPALKGLSVTIPYKQQVLQFVTNESEEVKNIRATNSIKISGSSLTAYNTDIEGFKRSFLTHLEPHHKKALILGTGGASMAVQFVLKNLNIDFLIVTRSSDLEKNFINYPMISESIMEEYNVVINCTPAGMWPLIDDCPNIPYNLITSHHYFFDLIYKPAETLFLKNAEQHGAVIQNGYDMLIIQAEESWKIWNSENFI